jgi:glycogen synthase
MRVALLTGSATAFDSRIRRTVRALAVAGFEVTLLSPDAAPPEGMQAQTRIRPVAVTRADVLRNLLRTAPATLAPDLALALHRRSAFYKAALAALIEARPGTIHANDWVTLPAAVDAAQVTGARVIYDTHEMATAEHAGHRWWRWLAQPHVAAIERALIGQADHVITVSEGLATELRALYGPAIRALSVVRNMPEMARTSLDAAPSDGQVHLAYAGLLRPERRIDVMIGALAHLDQQYRLTITGFGPESHLRELKALAQQAGVAARITWHPAVPPEALIDHLSGSHIGLFLSDGAGPQQQRALPNKVFEYMAAGAALVSSGSADVADLIGTLGNGVALARTTPEALAKAIAALGLRDIAQMRAASLCGAQTHSWSAERTKLLAIYAVLAPL